MRDAATTRRYWLCACGTYNPRVKQRCTNPDCTRRRPKRRVPRHARTLRDDGYPVYVTVSAQIHGTTDEACCCCGKPRGETRRHDRDHDHRTGQPRGLLCWRCNRELIRNATLAELRSAVAYLERVEAYYGG